jgi:hypothetical protein
MLVKISDILRGGYRGVLGVYTPKNDFVSLSLVNLVCSYTCKVPHRPLHPNPPKNEKVALYHFGMAK